MAVVETEALVLRTYNFGEADKVVVCLTRAEGLVRGVAKGCRKLKSRYGASLEPFTLLKLNYFHKENQELVSLGHADIIKSHFDLLGQAEVLAGLAYMGDLVIEFSPPYQANDRLFRMVTACLQAVAEKPGDLQLILRYFEIWLLRLEGYFPDIRNCSGCDRPFNEREVTYLGQDLLLRCLDCSAGRGSGLSRRLQQQLRDTQKLAPAAFVEASREVSSAIHKEMAELTHQMIARVLERQPRLRSSFQ